MKILALALVAFASQVSGHGRLMKPPSRNAMWRYGFTNPVNYNDNEVFCGGFGVQYQKNEGKCGVCGDNFADSTPRAHETGGMFGNGIIGERFVMGQKVSVEIDLTTNHWGYFEMKLCPSGSKEKEVDQECLDKYPLYLASDPTSSKFYIPKDTAKKDYIMYDVLLPQGITCSQCVVQWTYYTGNTWGTCKNGTEAVGCGDQETFRNCADIQIYSNAAGIPPNAVDFPNVIYFKDNSAPEGRRPLVITAQICVATDLYAKLSPDMDKWCQENCLKYPPNCPKSKCKCLDECEPIGRLKDVEGTESYCHRNCLRYPSTCPKDVCRCYSYDDPDSGSNNISE